MGLWGGRRGEEMYGEGNGLRIEEGVVLLENARFDRIDVLFDLIDVAILQFIAFARFH